MIPLTIAIVASGFFAGAAFYVTLVEHPARVSCGARLAVQEFGPSYRRGAIQQASLAIVGCAAGVVAGWQRSDPAVVTAAVLLGLVVPFTLAVIAPTTHRLLDPALDVNAPEATVLLRRWGYLHAVRSALSAAAFLLFVLRAFAGAG